MYNRSPVTGETPRNLVLLADTVKNYRSANLLVYKHGLLVICSHGRERPSSGGGLKGIGKVR